MSPVIIDIASYELESIEREKLSHPSVGGLILFSRNYADVKQLNALVEDIRKTVKRPFLISVDHEGGRVQRFREGFTEIPAMADIERLYPEQKTMQQELSQSMGFTMAYELISCGIDLSFAPVLDLNGVSKVIGSRAFSKDSATVIRLAQHYTDGMLEAGMKATGKHFPGHGSVLEDSHVDIPIDKRSFSEIELNDLQVFKEMIAQNKVQALMPAHVIFSQIDDKPAGFSPIWIKHILRKELGFKGVVFSDDLSMQAAAVAGDINDRAAQALDAGCTMILVCNSPKEAEKVLDNLPSSHHYKPERDELWHSLLLNSEIQNKLSRPAVQERYTAARAAIDSAYTSTSENC